jgi:nucleotide-binding universal stress UspA family protein
LRDASVTALFAWGFVPSGHPGDGRTFDVGFSSGNADIELRDAIEAAVGCDRARAITRRVVCDIAPRALLAAAVGADLVVVGARGVGGVRGLLMGSVGLQVLHHSTGPLAVVRAPAPGGSSPQRIVVGVDGSPSAARALRWALAEARLRGARVEVVHAWHPSSLLASPVVGRPVASAAIEDRACAVLDAAVDAASGALGGVSVDRLVVRESAARAVLDAALGADMVVLGSRGHGGVARRVLGSVTHHVALHATCPLVVVP